MTFRSVLVGSIALLASVFPTSLVTADENGWQIRSVQDVACRAVLRGDVVDTQLLRNRDNKMVLIVGNPRWNQWTAAEKATLEIDGGAPIDVNVSYLGPIVLVLIDGDEMTGALKRAASIKWHFTWGEFTAGVTGLGAAYDAISVCPG